MYCIECADKTWFYYCSRTLSPSLSPILAPTMGPTITSIPLWSFITPENDGCTADEAPTKYPTLLVSYTCFHSWYYFSLHLLFKKICISCLQYYSLLRCLVVNQVLVAVSSLNIAMIMDVKACVFLATNFPIKSPTPPVRSWTVIWYHVKLHVYLLIHISSFLSSQPSPNPPADPALQVCCSIAFFLQYSFSTA